MGLNEDILGGVVGLRSPFLDPIMVGLSVAGLLYFAVLWAIPLWVAGRRRDAVDLLLLLAVDAALVFVLKNAFAVPRPVGYAIAVPLDDPSGYAFPSGHATRAFAAAILLTARTRDWRWGAPLVAYATLVAFSRLYVGVHWPSDVVGGALLGLAWGYGFQWLTGRPAYATRRDRLLGWLARKPG